MGALATFFLSPPFPSRNGMQSISFSPERPRRKCNHESTLLPKKTNAKRNICIISICGAADRSGRGKRCSSCWCWGDCFVLTMFSFLGCEKEKLCPKRGVKRQKLYFKRGVKKQKLCLKKGCEKAKTWSQKLVDQSYFLIFSSFMNYRYIKRRRSVKGSLSCSLSFFVGY